MSRVTERDLQTVKDFWDDLKRVDRLKELGHARSCAVLMVFEKYPCSCPAGQSLMPLPPENDP